MIKILVKAAVLVCIILSIYFIVNPAACSNLISGRVVNSVEELPTFDRESSPARNELLTPQGDKGPAQPAQKTEFRKEVESNPESVIDTNSILLDEEADKQAAGKETFTQADIDYAIASRYVELENEYLAKKKDLKNAAKEISYIVMDDFALTPAEWEAFLQRATADNLFEKVRQQTSK